jgi:hypothetical protein
VRLVRQHQFRQHTFITTNGTRVLMLHDRAAIDMERGDKDELNMALGRVTGVLRFAAPLLESLRSIVLARGAAEA